MQKTWGRVVDDLFVALGIDKSEYLYEVEGGIVRQPHLWLVHV